jgi:hypothetical protein
VRSVWVLCVQVVPDKKILAPQLIKKAVQKSRTWALYRWQVFSIFVIVVLSFVFDN